jgi:hypothetical protein
MKCSSFMWPQGMGQAAGSCEEDSEILDIIKRRGIFA